MLGLDLSVPQDTPLALVKTTSGRGFTAEELAEQCVQRLVSVSDTAPPAIRDQAHAFKKQVQWIVGHYMRQAIASDRTTVYNSLVEAGHPELANLIRRL